MPGLFEQTIFALGKEEASFFEGGIPVRILPNESQSPNPMSGISGRLWKELASFDLIHVHQSLTDFGAFCAVVAKSLGKHLVMTDLGGGENALMLDGRGLELADAVISISRYAHSLIATKYMGRHEILMGPVDTDRFSPGSGPSDARRSAICVSRILPHKGIDRVIAALPDDMSLRVVGRIYHEPYLKRLKDLSKGKRVEFIHDASDDDLVEMYRASGVFVQASTSKDCYGNVVRKPELMGLTALEAMSCGLPAVLSDTGSLPELVPDSTFGIVFRSHDELARLFNDFLKGTWPHPDAARKARSHVMNHYSLNAVGLRLADFYSTIGDRVAKAS